MQWTVRLNSISTRISSYHWPLSLPYFLSLLQRVRGFSGSTLSFYTLKKKVQSNTHTRANPQNPQYLKLWFSEDLKPTTTKKENNTIYDSFSLSTCPHPPTYPHTNTHNQWKNWCHFEVSKDAQEAKSNKTNWEKWFQSPVITVLITYSALPLFYFLHPSNFRPASSWLQFAARRLSLCHPPYGFLSPSLSEAMETWFFYLVFLSAFFLSFVCSQHTSSCSPSIPCSHKFMHFSNTYLPTEPYICI